MVCTTKLFFIYIAIIFQFLKNCESATVFDDAGLTTLQLLEKYGYPVETHEVKTEDDYILTLYRTVKNNSSSKPPILLMHGVFCTSAVWLTLGPEKSLAYQLVDHGFDVWLANQRGTTYSRKHAYLDPQKDANKYFNYSFNEIGLYDVSTNIDYILKVTNQRKLLFVGHTQGFTDVLVLTSERPEYNEKILQITGLSPVAYISNAFSPIYHILSVFQDLIGLVLSVLNINEFFPPSDLITNIKIFACSSKLPTSELCALTLYALGGIDPGQLNKTLLPVMFTAIPAPCSVREFLHYLQEVSSGGFQKYDFGKDQNFLIYGQAKPPSYDVSKITVPVIMHSGKNDWISSIKDAEKLATQLPNLKAWKIIQSYDSFNHFDFLWAKDSNALLYNDVIQEIEEAAKNVS